MIECLLHDTMTFTRSDILTRHRITLTERSANLQPLGPARSFVCDRGLCSHETDLECNSLWLVVRVDTNDTCVQVWYGQDDVVLLAQR